MKIAILILSLMTMSVVALTQSKQEPGTGSSPNMTQTQIVELHLERKTEPLVLFPLALKDAKGNCKVHHHPLKVVTIPVIYGLLPGIRQDSYTQAERTEFPNAITRYEAGCLVLGSKEAKVLQCRKCLQAKRAWVSHRVSILTPKTNHADRRAV